MLFHIDVSPSLVPPAETRKNTAPSTGDLLQQILEVQREQLAQLKASVAAHDSSGRWKAFLSRWQQDFPELPDACRNALPMLERAYGALINDLSEQLRDNGGLDDDFALNEFLDRYGMRVGQLGTLLSVVAFLAEAASQSEPT